MPTANAIRPEYVTRMLPKLCILKQSFLLRLLLLVSCALSIKMRGNNSQTDGILCVRGASTSIWHANDYSHVLDMKGADGGSQDEACLGNVTKAAAHAKK